MIKRLPHAVLANKESTLVFLQPHDSMLVALLCFTPMFTIPETKKKGCLGSYMCKKTATAPIGPPEVAVLGAENTSSRFDVKEWGEGRLAAGIVSLMIMKKHSFQVQTRYKIGRMCLPNNPDQPTKPGRWICSFSDPSKRRQDVC